MAKKLNNYSVRAAGSWTIIQAISPEHALLEMATRLGVRHKEYLHKAIMVTPATHEEIERYARHVDVGPRKSDGRNVVREKLDG